MLGAGLVPHDAVMPRTVHLTRFTIRPDRRSELVVSAQSAGSASAAPWPDGTLLVELDDGDWLAVSITSGEHAVEELGSVDLAEGIAGDESGVIVAGTSQEVHR